MVSRTDRASAVCLGSEARKELSSTHYQHLDEEVKPIIVVLCTVLSLHVASYAQWEQTSGPDGGYVRSFVCDGSKVFAATGGGVLFSGDDGQSWEFRNTGLTRCDTKCLAMLDGCVYVSTDENIFHTCDDGLTWSANSDDVEGFYGKYLLNHGGTLLEGTYLRGVLRSTDAGETWVPANGGLPAKYVYYLATDGPRVFAATYHNGMYRTEDDGDTWTAINSGLSDWDVMSVHCFGGKVFISTLYDGAFVSTNNGDTW